ncbi:MAG: phosphatidylglycerophosphatase A [Candidatus Omnitrophota bacterium]
MKRDDLVKMIVTFFYAGESPFAPGTLGSFVGLLLFLAVFNYPGVSVFLFLLICALGFLTCGRAEKIFGKKDPPQVVIDEVAGIFIVFFMIPINEVVLLIGFVLFRILDIIKPFPARQLERLKGSYGIMLDDILCGIYANIILRIFLVVVSR